MLRSQKEEEEEEEEITIPSVDNFELLKCKRHTHSLCLISPGYNLSSNRCSVSVGQNEEGMSGIAIFFTVLFSMLGCIFIIVIGMLVYSHWSESRRKRFY